MPIRTALGTPPSFDDVAAQRVGLLDEISLALVGKRNLDRIMPYPKIEDAPTTQVMKGR
jgi:hypothetical protein